MKRVLGCIRRADERYRMIHPGDKIWPSLLFTLHVINKKIFLFPKLIFQIITFLFIL